MSWSKNAGQMYKNRRERWASGPMIGQIRDPNSNPVVRRGKQSSLSPVSVSRTQGWHRASQPAPAELYTFRGR